MESFRVVFGGETAVGKTALVTRLVDDGTSLDTISPTVMMQATAIELEYCGLRFSASLCDTAGQEKYQNMAAVYFTAADIVIMVYSVTDMDSINKINSWLEIADTRAPNAKRILVGNKTDLESERVVSPTRGQELANEIGAKFIETSAQTMSGIAELKNLIAEACSECIAERQKESADAGLDISKGVTGSNRNGPLEACQC